MATFEYGTVNFPLDADSANSLLRDADPAVYYALELFASVINTHIGARLVAEAQAAGATDITSAVAEAVPVNPEQFLTEEHFKFPLLTLHRESTTFKYVTQKRLAIHKLKCAYVLPPLRAAQAERLLPVLHAVSLVLDQKCADGRDDEYTPSLPLGSPGEFVWTKSRAGVAKAVVTDASTGAFGLSSDLFFPAVMLSVEMWDLSGVDANDGTFDVFEGADGTINLRDSTGTLYEPMVEVSTEIGPSLSDISPASGTSAGGTSVTITGLRFKPDTRPVVLFDGAAADGVTVVDATTITCRTPPHAAFPSFTADLVVIAADGQVAVLEQAFTFNTP